MASHFSSAGSGYAFPFDRARQTSAFSGEEWYPQIRSPGRRARSDFRASGPRIPSQRTVFSDSTRDQGNVAGSVEKIQAVTRAGR